MARFVSRYGNYSHGVRSEVSEVFSQGTRVVVRGLEAQFGKDNMTEYEVEQGLTKLSHHGQLEDRIDGGKISPRSRLSVFDSVATQKHLRWTDEERELVEKELRESPQNGVDFIEIAEPKRPAPWNGYDDIDDVERILSAVDATGVDPAEVLAYERENADREEVIAALEELLGDDAETEVVLDAS